MFEWDCTMKDTIHPMIYFNTFRITNNSNNRHLIILNYF